MLAAFAGTFAVPGELLAPPADPSSYLGTFPSEEQGREEELGCTIYMRSLPDDAEGKMLAAILPYSAGIAGARKKRRQSRKHGLQYLKN